MNPKVPRVSDPPMLTRFTPRSSSWLTLIGVPARPMTTLTGAPTSFTNRPIVAASAIPGAWRQSAPASRQAVALAADSPNGFGCDAVQASVGPQRRSVHCTSQVTGTPKRAAWKTASRPATARPATMATASIARRGSLSVDSRWSRATALTTPSTAKPAKPPNSATERRSPLENRWRLPTAAARAASDA